MQYIMSSEEYSRLTTSKELLLEEVRAQCQKEFEAAKDAFLKGLVELSDIREAFYSQRAYEHWRDVTRELVRKLNMPK